ncbi:response regulator [Aliifodinibius sp. S!AR15-10]|nr:response regulator [Aliifodinibius sp. S!AR15-10]
MKLLFKRALKETNLPVKEIYEAVNENEGLELIKYYNIDLILIGINMPMKEGLETLGQMRQNPEFLGIPAVVISSVDNEKLTNAIQKTGLGYLDKPFSQQALEAQIQKLETNSYGYSLQR